MTQLELLEAILDSMPTQIVFMDTESKVRYMNREAKYQNYDVLGYQDIMNHSLFDCHKTERAKEMIAMMQSRFMQNAPEMISQHPTGYNEIIYTTPVRDDDGTYLGMFERFELNLHEQKEEKR